MLEVVVYRLNSPKMIATLPAKTPAISNKKMVTVPVVNIAAKNTATINCGKIDASLKNNFFFIIFFSPIQTIWIIFLS